MMQHILSHRNTNKQTESEQIDIESQEPQPSTSWQHETVASEEPQPSTSWLPESISSQESELGTSRPKTRIFTIFGSSKQSFDLN